MVPTLQSHSLLQQRAATSFSPLSSSSFIPFHSSHCHLSRSSILQRLLAWLARSSSISTIYPLQSSQLSAQTPPITLTRSTPHASTSCIAVSIAGTKISVFSHNQAACQSCSLPILSPPSVHLPLPLMPLRASTLPFLFPILTLVNPILPLPITYCPLSLLSPPQALAPRTVSFLSPNPPLLVFSRPWPLSRWVRPSLARRPWPHPAKAHQAAAN